LKKFSEILSVPNLTDIHIALPPEGGKFAEYRLRVAGEIVKEDIFEVDLPGILPDKNEEAEHGEKRGLSVAVGEKQYRLRLTPSGSLGRSMMFVRVLPNRPLPIDAVSAEYFFKDDDAGVLLKPGLVLVSGQAGSGKSTYIASILQQIVTQFPVHVVSLEDPVEYIIAPIKGYATQKEVYFDSPSFSTALHDCMREDPDILFIGEIRDRETAETVLSAAESGHLVFGTIHAGSNPGIVDRLLGLFGSADSAFTSQRIAQCLRMCLSIKRDGMMVKYIYSEITDSLRAIIRNQALHQWAIYSSELTKEINWGKSKF
jgi:Tfp pilus assembly pilus retraction ATPase PilT